jgi:hypothetical protein
MWAGPGRDLGPGHLPPPWPAPAEAAGDDLRLDLGAAEARRDAAEPQNSQPPGESSALVSPPVTAGFHRVSASRGVRPVRAGRRSPARGSSDRAATPRAAAWPRRRRRTSGRGYPSRRCGRRLTGELIAAKLPQVLGVHDASDGGQVGSCSGQPARGNQDLSRGQDAHHNSMGAYGAR